MDHLVLLDANSGDLEKILRGAKNMIALNITPYQIPPAEVRPEDTLYFLRHNEAGVVRVKATVSNVLPFEADTEKDMSVRLKELQVNLQLTESQYERWAANNRALFIEFENVQKTPLIRIDSEKYMTQSEWFSIGDISSISD